jgi:lysyl-tRNA synthetase class 2
MTMDHARRLRREPTEAEARVWARLRNHQLGVKFRRQHRAEGFILDFACVEHLLAVELDGEQHVERVEHDAHRTAVLERAGWRVLRFWNHDALADTDAVVDAIWRALRKAPPHPNRLPRRRGRGSRDDGPAQSHADADSSRCTFAPAPAPPVSALLNAPFFPQARERAGAAHASASHLSKPQVPSPSPPQAGERVGVRGALESPADWTPSATFETLRLRARLNACIRAFFAQRGVVEVETPVLSVAGNTEPNIASFSLEFSGRTDGAPRTRWLRTSPEYPLKRLVAAGFGDCYELGRVFRDGEAGGRHNPEFTMLEWYRAGWDHVRLVDEVAALVADALALVGRSVTLETVDYRTLYRTRLGVDPMTAGMDELQRALGDVQIDSDGLTRDDWLDLLMTHRLQPAFGTGQLLAIVDYPATQCALARVRAADPPVAERFELYLGPLEIANGYHELADGAEQAARFGRDTQVRRSRGAPEPPIDTRLLAALAHGLPDCAGVAVGVDRLLMAMLGTGRIADVLAFDFARA